MPEPEDDRLHAFSVAMMAGIACLPIIIAVGFLTDKAARPAVADGTAAVLRGAFDAAGRSDTRRVAAERDPVRAGF